MTVLLITQLAIELALSTIVVAIARRADLNEWWAIASVIVSNSHGNGVGS